MATEFDDLLGLDEPLEPKDEFAPAANLPSVVGADSMLAVYLDDGLMLEFIRQTKTAPAQAMNDAIIGHGYAAVLWKFRAAALVGDIDRTRALKIWLDWAQPHIDKPKNEGEQMNNPLAANFGPREVK